MRFFSLALMLGLAGLLGGCIEIAAVFGTFATVGSDSPGITTGGDSPAPDADATSRPVVRLDVSNTEPFVNETVFLTCVIVAGDSLGVSFEFQPAGGRLAVDNNEASFIIDESDIGDEIVFTCSARSPSGVSELSNRVLILASEAIGGP